MNAQSKQKAGTAIVFVFVVLFALEISVQQWTKRSRKEYQRSDKLSREGGQESRRFNLRWQTFAPDNSHSQERSTGYSISDDVKVKYGKWHKLVWNESQIVLQPPGWRPTVDWNKHPEQRSDRFPSVEERVRYYMGTWFNSTIPMHGRDFQKATFIQSKSTREYGPFADIFVNLYNLNIEKLLDCYHDKKKLRVFSPYCRDYVDLAILHSAGQANVLHYIGDGVPYMPEEMRKYPLFAKVRHLCTSHGINSKIESAINKPCERKNSVESIILPLNRKRHFGATSSVPQIDIRWDKKKGLAVWRGKYGKTHDTLLNTNDMKFALVSKHLNSSLVDAKFAKHTKDAPHHMVAQIMDIKEQLAYKYIISVEGNDVSSGLKWMLFSNSVVLTPQFTWESWAMEGKLKPFEHYIPLKADMSNVEEMIQWADAHPEETLLISERSTLFIYDLLFHPDAMEDEKEIMIHIMEQFEQNFGSPAAEQKNALRMQWNKHPFQRSLRFLSVDERVKYAMGRWYYNNESISMKRSEMKNLPQLVLAGNTFTNNDIFIADGYQLTSCATTNSTHPKALRALCQSALPEFDERNTADIKSNSYNRLRETKKGKGIKLASSSSWRLDDKGTKESKRVLLDDSIKLLCFGRCLQNRLNRPFFAMSRSIGEDAILWPFSIDGMDERKLNWTQELDTVFEDKRQKATWNVGHVHSPISLVLSQAKLVTSNGISATRDDSRIPKKFFLRDDTAERRSQIGEMLTYRYLLPIENNAGTNDDLMWMLLSQSVVIMPAKKRTTSWLLESFLLPFKHFIPVASNYSDVDEKIRWCEDHLDEAKLISERATLFVHDLLLDRGAEKDSEEVKFRVMERYRRLFG